MVPEGWSQQEFGELATFHSGNTPSKKRPEFWGGDLPWITAKDLKKHRLNSSIDALTNEGYARAKVAPHGSSLVLVRGMTLFKTFPVGFAIRDVAFNQDVKAIVAKPGVDPLFLSYALIANNHRIRQLVSIAGHGTGRLETGHLKRFPIGVPEQEEQERIGDILSIWDQAIETTEKLIENSKAQKQALAQQLLTGKKRLPGFNDEWSRTMLMNIATVAVSPVNKKSVAGEPVVRLCNYTDVYYNSHITDDLDFMTATASSSQIKRFELQKNDLLITKDSETPSDIAVPALVTEDLDRVVCGYHLAIIRPDAKVAHGAFLNHLFSQPEVRHYFSTRANGATRFGLTIAGIKEASFTLPGIEEQQEIASILDTCEHELRSLSELLQETREEKRALMQQLLTGKRRVKVPA